MSYLIYFYFHQATYPGRLEVATDLLVLFEFNNITPRDAPWGFSVELLSIPCRRQCRDNHEFSTVDRPSLLCQQKSRVLKALVNRKCPENSHIWGFDLPICSTVSVQFREFTPFGIVWSKLETRIALYLYLGIRHLCHTCISMNAMQSRDCNILSRASEAGSPTNPPRSPRSGHWFTRTYSVLMFLYSS